MKKYITFIQNNITFNDFKYTFMKNYVIFRNFYTIKINYNCTLVKHLYTF